MCLTQTMQKLFLLRWREFDWMICVYAYMRAHLCMCACCKLCKEGKKAGVLKCHITQHGNYAHDMRCVSPHHHRPLSMCRTGPQPSTCAQSMHEMYTGMSLYRSPRVGNATLITFFLCWATSSLWLFLLLSLLFALCCPSAIKASTASHDGCTSKGQPWLFVTSAWMKALYCPCERVCQC